MAANVEDAYELIAANLPEGCGHSYHRAVTVGAP
ncbi:hypothetical protein [Streptomyces sp. NBC_01353]